MIMQASQSIQTQQALQSQQAQVVAQLQVQQAAKQAVHQITEITPTSVDYSANGDHIGNIYNLLTNSKSGLGENKR